MYVVNFSSPFWKMSERENMSSDEDEDNFDPNVSLYPDPVPRIIKIG